MLETRTIEARPYSKRCTFVWGYALYENEGTVLPQVSSESQQSRQSEPRSGGPFITFYELIVMFHVTLDSARAIVFLSCWARRLGKKKANIARIEDRNGTIA